MQQLAVSALPPCGECQAEDVNPPRDATKRIVTPTKQKLNVCEVHFLAFVEQRLGPGTVSELVVARKAGSR
jgi:hypothetical protein